MMTLLVYDSIYGNTEKIAKSIAAGLGKDVQLVRAAEAYPGKVKEVDLLVVGTPIHGGRPTPDVHNFIEHILATDLKGKKIAAFDTRTPTRFAKLFGYAADRIIDFLKEKGGVPIAPPEGFVVKGNKGPLANGELDRAAAWGRSLAEKLA